MFLETAVLVVLRSPPLHPPPPPPTRLPIRSVTPVCTLIGPISCRSCQDAVSPSRVSLSSDFRLSSFGPFSGISSVFSLQLIKEGTTLRCKIVWFTLPFLLVSPVSFPSFPVALFVTCKYFQSTFHSLTYRTPRLKGGEGDGEGEGVGGQDEKSKGPTPNNRLEGIMRMSPEAFGRYLPLGTLGPPLLFPPAPLPFPPIPLPSHPSLCFRIRRGVDGTGVSRRPFNSNKD